jgi:hypothetical protein
MLNGQPGGFKAMHILMRRQLHDVGAAGTRSGHSDSLAEH